MPGLFKLDKKEGPRQVFRDPGSGLFEGRDPGVYSKKAARCAIVIMNGTREAAIYSGGIREIVT